MEHIHEFIPTIQREDAEALSVRLMGMIEPRFLAGNDLDQVCDFGTCGNLSMRGGIQVHGMVDATLRCHECGLLVCRDCADFQVECDLAEILPIEDTVGLR